jgi:carboxymethylenebutenolidase
MRGIGLVVLATLVLFTASCNRDEQSKKIGDEHAGHSTAGSPGVLSNPALDPTRTAGPLATFPSRAGEASGYLSVPPAKGRKPAVIVIHEWWGLDEWVRDQTDRFSQQGYVALAVDLYRGRTTSSMEEAHELSRGLPEDRAIADLQAAVDFLSARVDVDPQRIGVIGWCMGGGYALKLATREPRLQATVINYGSLVTDPALIASIKGEVLGNFGGADRGIPPADVKTFQQALTTAGKDGDVKIYEGAGHAFMNPNNKQGYDAAATQDAWSRIDRFFARTLRATISNS